VVRDKRERLLSFYGTPVRPQTFAEEALWLGTSGWACAEVRLPSKPSFVILSVKSAPMTWWNSHLPSDVGFVAMSFPADPRGSRLLARVLPPFVPVVFIGDLDPPSIVQYMATRDRLSATVRARLRFGGVDSAWLADIESALKPLTSLRHIQLALSGPERRLLRALEDAIRLESFVGPRAAELLRNGFKLELEGAMNPKLFRKGRTARLFDELRRRASASR
jgi:hypothetical protein